MKTPILFAVLTLTAILFGTVRAEPPKPAEDGSIEATVIAVNRGFGFLIVNAGSKQGVKTKMKVSILRDKKRISGILRIAEVDEIATILEYFPGKSGSGLQIDRVIFEKPGREKK